MKTNENAQACIRFLTEVKKECPQFTEGIETVQEYLIEDILDCGEIDDRQREKNKLNYEFHCPRCDTKIVFVKPSFYETGSVNIDMSKEVEEIGEAF